MELIARAAATIMRPIWRRRLVKNQPPKGSRPEVMVVYDGVTYDVTEDLLRINDNEEGWAVWVVVGPAHLRVDPSKSLMVNIALPPPRHTRVDVLMVSEPPRFRTVAELKKFFPELK